MHSNIKEGKKLTNQVQLTELQKKQIETYLKEYEVLRSEIPNKEQRIQSVLSLYIAALLGVAVYIMKEGFDEVLKNIEKSNFSIGIMLLIPIINSLLLIYCISFMYVINAIAKYTTFVIGNDVSNILKAEFFRWDKWDSKEKQAWLEARGICGILVFILLNSISFAILYRYNLVFLMGRSLVLFFIWALACIVSIYCVYSGIKFLIISKRFHEN